MFELSDARQNAFHHALNVFSDADCTHFSLPFFTSDEIASMIAASKDLSFRKATAVVGNQVHQDMEVCFPAPRKGVYDDCATLLETGVNSWSEKPNHLPADLHLNDFAVQRYGQGSKGIGIHKDGLRYKYIVFIITLSGSSRLFYSDDRQGTNRYKIHDEPGQLVLLKAPEFGNFPSENRLLHGVDKITGGRLSIGFRHEVISP